MAWGTRSRERWIVSYGPDGKIKLFNGSLGTVQLLADVTGYFIGGTPQ